VSDPTSDALWIRRAGPEDASRIADVYLRSRAEALPYLARIHTDDETRSWVRDVCLQRGEVWVAELSGRIVGFVAVDGEDLDQLYLEPGYYRQRIGTRLLEKAKALSPSGLHLYVFQRNARARAFYEAHGFTLFDLNNGARNEEGEPDAQYQWRGALSRRASGAAIGPEGL